MIIDRLLYFLVPKMVHEWAAENRAKVRAYALAFATPVAVWVSENYIPEEWSAAALAALGSTGAVIVGRQTHKVVSPWDEDA